MSNKPTTPSFILGYWRPWKEDSDLIDSYLDYAKDVSLVKYGADVVGQYIQQANQETVRSINELGNKVGFGLMSIENQLEVSNSILEEVNSNLCFLNKQMNCTNEILQNISQLLKIPDNEKERQRAIELGLKFFRESRVNSELYKDALEEFTKAENLMKQDYFVLHHLGLIYMKGIGHIDVKKAYRYFTNAAKYAEVESNPDSVLIYNELDDSRNYSRDNIKLIAAESFSWAALAAYVDSRFEDAVNNQKKAVEYRNEVHDVFTLAKYQVRNQQISDGLKSLENCIQRDSEFANLVFKDFDLISEKEVRQLISKINDDIDTKIKSLHETYGVSNSTESALQKAKLYTLLNKRYDVKNLGLPIYKDLSEKMINKKELLIEKSLALAKVMGKYEWNDDTERREKVKNNLINLKNKTLEEIERDYENTIIYCKKHNIELTWKDKKAILHKLGKNDWKGLESEKGTLIEGLKDGKIERTQNSIDLLKVLKFFLIWGPIGLLIYLVSFSKYKYKGVDSNDIPLWFSTLILFLIIMPFVGSRIIKRKITSKKQELEYIFIHAEKKVADNLQKQNEEAERIFRKKKGKTISDDQINDKFETELNDLNRTLQKISKEIDKLED